VNAENRTKIAVRNAVAQMVVSTTKNKFKQDKKKIKNTMKDSLYKNQINYNL
jgi:hypothetical protein